ncbi:MULTISPECIES: hypothetical protein [unclassified Mesorhizobium]|uniref:hypothetical protein n=1 Tax=unclassified Mesorhizobium TaxID=325217 RepID=UPI000BAF7601|nr:MULTISPECIES: hypothetical protein [unclassified Mesorhizobium]PBB37990.1 hypothetical protein CK221_08470 [Mesorhizobium sp. WSM3868]PBB96645.1 hypothetical protein CK224_20330 [Mesorhizobium sp. WSM3862]
MERMSLVRSLVAAVMLMPHAGATAANTDPDWPCMQRKVPQLVAGVSLIERERDGAKELILELGSCVLFLCFLAV